MTGQNPRWEADHGTRTPGAYPSGRSTFGIADAPGAVVVTLPMGLVQRVWIEKDPVLALDLVYLAVRLFVVEVVDLLRVLIPEVLRHSPASRVERPVDVARLFIHIVTLNPVVPGGGNDTTRNFKAPRCIKEFRPVWTDARRRPPS